MNYQTIPLTDIALKDLTPVRISLQQHGAQDHSRWVLRSPKLGSVEAQFVKMWNPSYAHRDNILAAIECGFYDERLVPALHALIFHKGLCRGYVMKEGIVRRDALTGQFRELVYLRTCQTGYFAVQFGRAHTMIYQGRRSLLDLEAVYPIADFPRLAEFYSCCGDPAYESHVANLWRKSLAADTAVSGQAPSISYSAPDKPIAGPWAFGRGLWAGRSQRIRYGMRNLMPRLDLIKY